MKSLTQKIRALFLFSLVLSSTVPSIASSFAIVTDAITAQKLQPELARYAQVIQERNLTPILLVDIWQHPDSIRYQLQKLYKEHQLEGAVFIGDIPIPMIRDAQHLATAFKMNQSRDWKESSIPSDRFYDDFNLKFDYIKQDSTERLYHYYSLRADSQQFIRCHIYSARIKPPLVPGKDKYKAIGEYLNKVAAFSHQVPPINKVLYFAGHGYNSNCMIARIDEKMALREQFPDMGVTTDNIQYIDFTFDDYSKYRLLAALQDPDLGLAILHHHGSEDAQLLNGSPRATEANRWISLAQKFFRGKIRSASDTVKTKQYYLDNYPIPESWVSNAFDPKWVVADSLADASININIPDLYGYSSQAKVIILDACFNGSFHLDDYIAGYYIFNAGETMVVKANSVNTLQDTWTNQLMELLPMGARIGLWAKGQMTLESHLLGDPSFAFAPSALPPSALPPSALNTALAVETQDPTFWKPLLQPNSSATPALRALSIKRLQEMDAITGAELLSIQSSDPSAIVRLQAFIQMVAMANEDLPQAILLGINDSYELTRRLAMLYASKNGAPELLPALAAFALRPTNSARVNFQHQTAVGQYRGADYIAAVTAQLQHQEAMWMTPKRLSDMENTNRRSDSLDMIEYKGLFDPSVTVRSKQFTLSSLRNSCNPVYLDTLFQFLREEPDAALRLQLAEALGWYRYSYYKPEIQKELAQILQTEKEPDVVNELQKTINRLK